MDICFEGVGQTAATFQAGEGVKPGMAVAMTGNGAVGLGSDGALPCGVVLGGVRDGAAAVQIGGAAEVAYSGDTAPTAGWQELVLNGAGGVRLANKVADQAAGKTVESGLLCLVLTVDTTAKTAVVCM